MKKIRGKIILIALGIALLGLAAPFILLFGTTGIVTVKERLSRRAFDSHLWKQGSEDEIRIRMVDSLLREHDLAGLTRGEIVELLGDPDDTSFFRQYDMVYRLGNERGFISVDSEWLVLKLDTNQVVTEHRVVPD